MEAPITYSNCFFYDNSLCISSEYYKENKEEIDEIVKFVIKNKSGKLTIMDTTLINDDVINEITNNPNINAIILDINYDSITINDINNLFDIHNYW